MGLRSWHLAVAALAAEVVFVAGILAADPPYEALDVVTHALVAILMLAIGALGLFPVFLLWHPRTRRAGRWTALALGAAFTVSVFWTVEGVVLLLAAGWAFWKERDPAAARLGAA